MQSRPDHTWVERAGDRFALQFEDGVARIDGVDLLEVARAVGTPTYVYGARHVEQRYQALASAVRGRPTSICYAVKANSSQAILRTLARAGAGADIVSGGELSRALAAGMPPERIVFSGVGKTDDEIDAALQTGIRCLNLESPGELERVHARAQALSRPARIALRVNPDVDPATHPYLATGLLESKFGIAMDEALPIARRAAELPGIELTGLACHIGSQITDTAPFVDSFSRLRALVQAVTESGVELDHLDLGGGFGIAYGAEDPELDVQAWGAAVLDASKDLDLELVLEPGRFLVAHAGVLLTRVIGTKRGTRRSFVIVDAAMNDLLRPALYKAYHAIVPVRLPPADAPVHTVDVVGPICESGDFFAQHRSLSEVQPGETMAILSAGAYGMVMASSYNTRPLPAEVLVRDGQWAVTRPRRKVEDLLAEEQYPDWLK